MTTAETGAQRKPGDSIKNKGRKLYRAGIVIGEITGWRQMTAKRGATGPGYGYPSAKTASLPQAACTGITGFALILRHHPPPPYDGDRTPDAKHGSTESETKRCILRRQHSERLTLPMLELQPWALTSATN